MANCFNTQHFCNGDDYANLVSSFRGSNYLPTI